MQALVKAIQAVDGLAQGRTEQGNQGFLQGLPFLLGRTTLQLAGADLLHQQTHQAPAGAILRQLAELALLGRQVAVDLLPAQMERSMLDQAMGHDLAGSGGVQQRHVPRGQFDTFAALAQARMAAALDDEEAMAIVLMIDLGALAGDQPSVGADLRHLQPGVILHAHFTNEQGGIARRTGIESTADALQGAHPGTETMRSKHCAPPEAGSNRLCCYGDIINMLSICQARRLTAWIVCYGLSRLYASAYGYVPQKSRSSLYNSVKLPSSAARCSALKRI